MAVPLKSAGEYSLVSSLGLLVSKFTGGPLGRIQYWQPEEKYKLLALYKGYFRPVNIFSRVHVTKLFGQ